MNKINIIDVIIKKTKNYEESRLVICDIGILFTYFS